MYLSLATYQVFILARKLLVISRHNIETFSVIILKKNQCQIPYIARIESSEATDDPSGGYCAIVGWY